MSEIQSAARAALALNALASAVLDSQKAARAAAYDRLADAGVRGPVDVAADDGEPLGTVSRTRGRATARVADEAAYTAWVQLRYPDRVRTVRVVDEAFTDRVLHTAKLTGTAVDTETGEVIPGVVVSEGEPGITVRPNGVAKERMRALLAGAGLLALPAVEDGGDE